MDKCRLITGDSAEKLKELASNSVDLTVTSPPYDNLRIYNGYGFDFETIARELYRVTLTVAVGQAGFMAKKVWAPKK